MIGWDPSTMTMVSRVRKRMLILRRDILLDYRTWRYTKANGMWSQIYDIFYIGTFIVIREKVGDSRYGRMVASMRDSGSKTKLMAEDV